MASNHNHNHTLHLRRPNGPNANANANAADGGGAGAPAPAAPQPMPQSAPGALVSYSGFIGVTSAFQLAPGFYLIDWQAASATADLYLEAQDLRGAWAGARCLNVMRAVGTGSGLTLGASGSFRFNNAGLGAASITISGP
jgi:hypothetical protein